MAYLTQKELKTVCPISLVEMLNGKDESITTQIVDESIALMKSYLAKNYDIDAIFDESKPKNQSIFKRLKDIVIYELYIRHTREMNEVAEDRYNRAIEWLEKLNTGEFFDSTLPMKPLPESPSTEGEVRFGGNQKYQSKY